MLLAIAPVAGLGRVVSAAPKVATALEYDVEAALEKQTISDRAGGRSAIASALRVGDHIRGRIAS